MSRQIALPSGVKERFDANESLFFEKQLTDIDAEMYKWLYPENNLVRNVPVQGGINPGANYYEYRMYNRVGNPKVVSAAGDDLPIINGTATQTIIRIESIGEAVLYTTQEVKAAAMAGMDISRDLVMMARDAIAAKIDLFGWVGRTTLSGAGSITGIVYNSNVTKGTVATGATSTKVKWLEKLPSEVLYDLNAGYQKIVLDSLGVIKPNRCALPGYLLAYIMSTPVQSGSDTTIGQFFLNTHPGFQFVDVAHLDGLTVVPSTGAAGTTSVAVMYKADPTVLSVVLPVDYEQLPAQPENLDIKIPIVARMGSVAVRQPKGVNVMEGIA